MKIRFDKYGMQVAVGEARMAGFYNAITSAGWLYETGGLESIPDDVDVVVLTTRYSRAYSPEDLAALVAFVQRGGGLWCMANHAAFPSNGLLNDLIRYDSAVASTFYVSYQAAVYGAAQDAPVYLTGSNLGSSEIITGSSSWPLAPGSDSQRINAVVTRSFSAIYPTDVAEPVCLLANLPQVTNAQSGKGITEGVAWMVSIDGGLQNGSQTITGRILIGADAGWLGDTNTNRPGPGEYQRGDNPQFSLNALAWLAKLS